MSMDVEIVLGFYFGINFGFVFVMLDEGKIWIEIVRYLLIVFCVEVFMFG